MRTNPLRLGCGVALGILTVAGMACAAPADLDSLFEGADEFSAPGCLSAPLSVFGPDAFVVTTGAAGESRLPVIAAAHFGDGRVLATGHEGMLGGFLAEERTATFMSNAARWAGGGEETVSVGIVGGGPLSAFLSEAGHSVTDIAEDDLAGDLSRFDVIVASGFAFDTPRATSRIQSVTEFIAGGGGLVTGTCAWGWQQLNPNRNIRTEFGGNLLLAPMGLVWVDATVGLTTGSGYADDRGSLELAHAGAALALLESYAAGATELTEDQLSQIGTTLSSAVRAIPADDAIFMPEFHRVVERTGSEHFPTPDTPVTTADPLARIVTTQVQDELMSTPAAAVEAHPAAEGFPGPVPDEAERVTKTVTIDATMPPWLTEGTYEAPQSPYGGSGAPIWHSTGCYAAPGELVTVTVPEDQTGKGLAVRIGCHSDAIWGQASWTRFPEITRVFPIESSVTEAANAFGGLVYVLAPFGEDLGTFDLQIEGVVEAPYFVNGVTSLAEWRDTIRNRAAPWGELACDGIILTLPTETLRTLDDPEDLLCFWDYALISAADLAAWERDRIRPERFVTDVLISVGYMHSGYPLMAFLDMPEVMISKERIMAKDHGGVWGLFHEIGHNHQAAPWTFDGTTEVGCNLFTLYMMERAACIPVTENFALYDPSTQEKIAAHLEAGAPFDRWKSDPFLALAMYVQMQQAFGWGAFQRVFAGYRDAAPSELPTSDDGQRDQWLVRFSTEVGRDLGPFFELWGVPTSEEARASIAHLPRWLPAGFPPED